MEPFGANEETGRYDMSLESKKKEFNDFPLEIFHQILMCIDHPVEKIKLRKVCRNFKNIIDAQNAQESRLEIGYQSEFVRIQLAEGHVYYCPTRKGCSVEAYHGRGEVYRGREMFFKKRNFLKMAFGHIEYLLKLPNLKLNELGMDTDDIDDSDEEEVNLKGMGIEDDFLGYEDKDDSDDDSDEEDSNAIKAHNRIDSMRIIPFLVSILESMSQQLHTESISFYDIKTGDFARILKCLQPSVLKTIQFSCPDDETDEEQAQIVYESQQWKQAEERNANVGFNGTLLFLRHSETVGIWLWGGTPDELVRIREFIYTLPNFKRCRIHYSLPDSLESHEFPFEDIFTALGPCTEIANSPTTRVYKIPGSEKTLEFEFKNDGYYIKIDVTKLP